MANIIFSVTYYQTPKDVFGPCVWEEVDNEKDVKKMNKFARFVKKKQKNS